MKSKPRAAIAVLVSVAIVLPASGCSHQTVAPQIPLVSAVYNPLQEDLQKPCLELFKIAPRLEYNAAEIGKMRDYLGRAEDYCKNSFKERSRQYEADLQRSQADLKRAGSSISDTQRHDIHCRIQNLRALKSQTDVIADHAIPVAYQNKQAKLELIEKWPAAVKEIRQAVEDGSFDKRRWGDVKDIGFREIAPGQQDDIKLGKEAVDQMKQSGLMPPILEDKTVVDYTTQVAGGNTLYVVVQPQ